MTARRDREPTRRSPEGATSAGAAPERREVARATHVPPGTSPAPPVPPYQIPTGEARLAALAQLRFRFPGVMAWYGEATGRYWAFLPEPGRRGCLLEAATPAELAGAIASARGWPWPGR